MICYVNHFHLYTQMSLLSNDNSIGLKMSSYLILKSALLRSLVFAKCSRGAASLQYLNALAVILAWWSCDISTSGLSETLPLHLTSQIMESLHYLSKLRASEVSWPVSYRWTGRRHKARDQETALWSPGCWRKWRTKERDSFWQEYRFPFITL